MTDAARVLGLTQSAVSQIVARLEHQLGVSLFDRSTRPPSLTEAGEVLLKRGHELLGQCAAVLQEIQSTATQGRPRVRVGLIDSVAGTIGASLIRSVRSEAREVSVWSGISPALRRDLVDGRLDIVVTSDPQLRGEGKSVRLLQEPFIAIVPKEFDEVSSEVSPMRLSELLPLVRYSERSVIGAEIEEGLRARAQVPPRVFEFDGSDGVFAMVSGGLGWAITTPLCLVHGRKFADGVRALPLTGPSIAREVRLLAANAVGESLMHRVGSRAVELLSDLLEAEFNETLPDISRHMRIG